MNKLRFASDRENDGTEEVVEKNLHNRGIYRIEGESITRDD